MSTDENLRYSSPAKSKRTILIAAGGTAGHLYPAKSLARELITAGHKVALIGGELKKNSFLDEEKFPLLDIPCGKLAFYSPKELFSILKGVRKSRSYLRNFRPDLIIGFGSYHTFPALVSAAFYGVPILLHEANSAPGRVNRFFSRFAMLTGVQFERAARKLKGKSELVAMPLREEIVARSIGKEQALAYYGLKSDRKTVLIFGGSQGARTLNQKVSRALVDIGGENLQVIHFSGQNGDPNQLLSHYRSINLLAVVKVYEKQMHFAWEAADLVIARAGAGTIAEQIAYATPALYIPFPYATDGHQLHNARFVEQIGGSFVLEERSLAQQDLSSMIERLLFQEPVRQQMIASLKEYQLKERGYRKFSSLIEEALQ